MIYEITGEVQEVGKTMSFASGFSKRGIVVDAREGNSKYPNILQFSAVKDNCSLLDGFVKGDKVKIAFAIDGRIWDGPKGRSYFTDLKIIRIETVGAAKATPTPAVASPSDADLDVPMDDMPF